VNPVQGISKEMRMIYCGICARYDSAIDEEVAAQGRYRSPMYEIISRIKVSRQGVKKPTIEYLGPWWC